MSSEAPVPDVTAENPDVLEDADEENEIRLMKQRVKEMEEEAAKLRELQAAAEAEAAQSGEGTEGGSMETEEDRAATDSRSIYVGNVDYGGTPEELQAHFGACGTINRITILCDKFTGHPKGFAYVEFAEPEHVDAALALDSSLFRGRLLKVTAKRTNVPSFILRGRGRGRAGYRGGYRGGHQGFNPYGRGRGRGRGRGY